MKTWNYISFTLLINLLITSCSVEPRKTVPEIYKTGQEHFHRVCANCHGPDAMGGNKAPKLIQKIYSQANFSDIKIIRTILNGSNSGAMPSQKRKVTEKEIYEILNYLRYSQNFFGIS